VRDTDLLVDSQNGNTHLAAFGEGLGVWILAVILALSVNGDRLRSLTLGEEEEIVDPTTNLLRQLQELESLSRLEQDKLVAFILLALRDKVLGNVSKLQVKS
jgi:hypothetical protein